MRKIKYFIPVFFTIFYIYSCSSDGGSDSGKEGDNFNRLVLTTSWVDNLLLPAAEDFQAKLNTLNISANAFTETPNSSTLAAVRIDLFEAYKVWQHVEMFFYGTSFSLDVNKYPTSPSKIMENIDSTSELNLDRSVLNDTQGLPALDYLVNGLEATDDAIIAKYQEAKYKDYLKLLTSRLVTITTNAVSNFETDKSSKVASVDNTISSYFSIQVNDFVQYTEKSFREAKIAIPSGTRNRAKFPTISVDPSPGSVESLYSPENSKTLYLEAYDAVQDFYYGRSYAGNSNTVGLQEYLQDLGTTIMVDGEDILLDDYIVQLFVNIDAANNNISNNFFVQTQDYNSNFDAVFDAIQEFVVAIKTNAISAFNLTIDFEDSDGD